MRLRGDYAAAMNVIQGIIASQPTHVEANSLMGDVLSEVGDWDAALLYYRNAEDHGGGEVVKRKRIGLEQRLAEHARDALETKLGLAQKWEQIARWTGVGLACIAVLVLALALLNRPRPTSPPPDLRVPIIVGSSGATVPAPAPTSAPTRPSTEAVSEDALIRAALQGDAETALLRGVAYDPRSSTAILTFEANIQDEPLAQARAVGAVCLTKLPDVQRLTIRMARDGKLLAMLDLIRDSAGKPAESNPWPDAVAAP